jgi:glyoxylase-like metal-dependent hydrolase (beta-lactamase superfamily II)
MHPFMSSRVTLLSLAITSAMLAAWPLAAPAQNTQATTVQTARFHAQAGVFRYRLGAFEITALSDGSVPQDLHALLKGASAGEIDTLLAHAHRANPVEASINAYLVDTGSRLMLVDVGAGDFFGPGYGGKLVARLKRVGVDPAGISDILLTHVHTDHSGGLVRNGKALFPKATVHVGKGDVDFFLARQNQQGVNGYDKAYFEQATLSLSPYVAAGRVKPFNGVTELAPGVTALPTPGHTPGHAFFRVESQGKSITFIGDIVHVQAVQFPKPDITITYDVDNDAARQQRLAQFRRLAKDGVVVAGAHMPFPGIGQVSAEGQGFVFTPVDPLDRDGL